MKSCQTFSENNVKFEKVKVMQERQKRWMEERSGAIAKETSIRPKLNPSSGSSRNSRSVVSKPDKKQDEEKKRQVMLWTTKNPDVHPDSFVVRNKSSKVSSARSQKSTNSGTMSDRSKSGSANKNLRKSSSGSYVNVEKTKIGKQENCTSTPDKKIENQGFGSNFSEEFSTINLSDSEQRDFDSRFNNEMSNIMHDLEKTSSVKSGKRDAISFSMHCCPHCKQLMSQRENSPYLIFPCGHNICGQCLQEQSKCPTCQVKISSTLENSMLRKVIADHQEQEEKEELARKEKEARKYVGEYDSLKTRCDILSYKAEGVIENMEQITNDLVEKKTAMKQIEEDGEDIRNQIQHLQEKLSKCENSYGEYNRECDELELSYQKEKENLDLLENTLHRVKESKERVKTLIQNFIPSFKFQDEF